MEAHAKELMDPETGELVNLPVQVEGERFDLATIQDPTGALRVAEELVTTVADRCTGEQYVAQIAGKQYPRVEWWTTVGASLGLFPREERNRRLEREGETCYEATVGVYRGDSLVTRASAICSSRETLWSNRDEYAIKSMATTRATGKAYRIGLSFLAVMAGLEHTSAEEMPSEPAPFAMDAPVGFGKHEKRTWAELVEKEAGYVRWAIENVDRLSEDAKAQLRAALEGGETPEPEPEKKSADDQPATAEQKARIANLMEEAGIPAEVRVKKEAAMERGITRGQARAAIAKLEADIEEIQQDGFFTVEEKAVPEKDELRKDIVGLLDDLAWSWPKVHKLTDDALDVEHDPDSWEPNSWARTFMALPLEDCQRVHAHLVEQAAKESDDA